MPRRKQVTKPEGKYYAMELMVSRLPLGTNFQWISFLRCIWKNATSPLRGSHVGNIMSGPLVVTYFNVVVNMIRADSTTSGARSRYQGGSKLLHVT